MSVNLRPARPADLSFVRACAQAAYAPYVQRMGQRPAPMDADFEGALEQEQCFVLEEATRPLGYAIWFPEGDTFFIENIAIAPREQGRGLGIVLMNQAETAAKQRGLTRLRLYTNVKMLENIAFYTRLGFAETERRRENGFHRVYLEKHLKSRFTSHLKSIKKACIRGWHPKRMAP
ncbi:MAG: GNAT family N-acetyltransferase [Pseudomonadota bacterium]